MVKSLIHNLFRKGAVGLAVLALLLSILSPMPGMVYGDAGGDVCGHEGAQSPGSHDHGGLVDHQCPLCLFLCHLSLLPATGAADQFAAPWMGLSVQLVILDTQWFSVWRAYGPLIPRAPPVFA